MYYCALLRVRFFIPFHVIPCPSTHGLTQEVSGLIFSIIYVLLCTITCTFLYILPCNTMSFTSWTNTACKWSDLFYHLCITVHYYVYVLYILPCNTMSFTSWTNTEGKWSDLFYQLCITVHYYVYFFYILPCNTMSFTSWTNTEGKWSDLFYQLCITVHYYVYVSLYPSM